MWNVAYFRVCFSFLQDCLLGLTDVSVLMTCDLPYSPLIFLISHLFCGLSALWNSLGGGVLFCFLNNCGCWDAVKGSGRGLVGAAWEPCPPLFSGNPPQLPPLVWAFVSASPALLTFGWWYFSDFSPPLRLLDNSWHFSCGLPSLLHPRL